MTNCYMFVNLIFLNQNINTTSSNCTIKQKSETEVLNEIWKVKKYWNDMYIHIIGNWANQNDCVY